MDVGGGYHEDGLSNCTLRWMLDKANAICLKFNDYSAIESNPLDIMHDSMKPYYKILGIVNMKIGNGADYNETVSPGVIERYNANTDNYKEIANPNINYFVK